MRSLFLISVLIVSCCSTQPKWDILIWNRSTTDLSFKEIKLVSGSWINGPSDSIRANTTNKYEVASSKDPDYPSFTILDMEMVLEYENTDNKFKTHSLKMVDSIDESSVAITPFYYGGILYNRPGRVEIIFCTDDPFCS